MSWKNFPFKIYRNAKELKEFLNLCPYPVIYNKSDDNVPLSEVFFFPVLQITEF